MGGGEFLHCWDKFYLKILEIIYTINSQKIAENLTQKSRLMHVDGNSVNLSTKGIYLVSDPGNKAERKCFLSSIPETEFVSLEEVTLN